MDQSLHAPRTAPKAWHGYAYGLTGVIIFAATLPMTRLALGGYSPALITVGRALIAALVAGLVLVALRRRVNRKAVRNLFLAGILLIYGFPGFSSVAMQTVPASHGGIVLGILPLLTALFATLFAGERPSPAFWFWSVAGALAVLTFTLGGGGIEPETGDLWLALAAACASLGYVMSGKLARTMAGWEVISWALVLTAPLSLVGVLLVFRSGIHDPGLVETGAFLYLSLGSMFLGFVFWNRGLALGGIARVGQVQLLQTFFTIAFAALLLGEPVTASILGFAALVAFCVFMGRKAQIR